MKTKNRKTGNTIDLDNKVVQKLKSMGVGLKDVEKREVQKPAVLKKKEE